MNTNYAGFWKRFVAIIIDVIIIGALQAFIVIPILAAIGIGAAASISNMDNMGPDEAVGMVATIMALIGTYWIAATTIQVLYFSLMESSKLQATVGKLALGMIVTDTNGNKLEFGRALGRNLARILSNFTLFIGYIIAGFTEKKQALHDIIAGTLVVNKA